MVGDKVEEVKWKGLGVSDYWQQMKDIYNDGNSSDICEMTKGPHRQKETWWWNEEVAEAVEKDKVRKVEERKHGRGKDGV